MSCHTWVYIKEEDIDDKILKEFVADTIKRLSLSPILHMTYDKWKARPSLPLSMKEKSYFDTCIAEITNKLCAYKEGAYSFEMLKEDASLMNIRHNGKVYYNIQYEEVFRISDFCDDIIESKESLIEFAKKNKSGYACDDTGDIKKNNDQDYDEYIKIVDSWATKLFKKYPHCIIDFG